MVYMATENNVAETKELGVKNKMRRNHSTTSFVKMAPYDDDGEDI